MALAGRVLSITGPVSFRRRMPIASDGLRARNGRTPSKSERPVSEKNPTFRGDPRRDVEGVHHRLSRRGASPLQGGHVQRPLNRLPVSPKNISRDREHGYSVTSGPA
jgi:hypothetical protein